MLAVEIADSRSCSKFKVQINNFEI